MWKAAELIQAVHFHFWMHCRQLQYISMLLHHSKYVSHFSFSVYVMRVNAKQLHICSTSFKCSTNVIKNSHGCVYAHIHHSNRINSWKYVLERNLHDVSCIVQKSSVIWNIEFFVWTWSRISYNAMHITDLILFPPWFFLKCKIALVNTDANNLRK